jgi:hypothetical protein
MLKIRSCVAFAALSALTMMGAPGPARAATCTMAGSTALDAAPSVTHATVDDGKIAVWKITVPSGVRGFFHVHPDYGDVDITVCKKDSSTILYHGHNMFDDGQHLPEGNVPCPAGLCTGENVYEWGPPLNPGVYRLEINACFSSKDADNCDYSTIVPNVPPGTLDPIPAIPYQIAYLNN